MTDEVRIALLIDAENISAQYAQVTNRWDREGMVYVRIKEFGS